MSEKENIAVTEKTWLIKCRNSFIREITEKSI